MVMLKMGARSLLIVLALAITACQAPGAGDVPEPPTESLPETPVDAQSPVGMDQKADDSATGAAQPGPMCECPVLTQPSCPAPEPAPACPKPPVTDRNHFEGKLIVGQSEYVYIESGPLKLRARIDSGATTSSLHAGDIVRFERDGEAWVRFTTWANTKEKPTTLELPVSRKVRIKTKTEGIDQRVVVEVNLRVGDVTQRVEVTLADRGDFEYPVLIGRNYLRDVAVIDVSRTYVHGD